MVFEVLKFLRFSDFFLNSIFLEFSIFSYFRNFDIFKFFEIFENFQIFQIFFFEKHIHFFIIFLDQKFPWRIIFCSRKNINFHEKSSIFIQNHRFPYDFTDIEAQNQPQNWVRVSMFKQPQLHEYSTVSNKFGHWEH